MMEASDIKYVLALARRDLLLLGLRETADSLSATILKLQNLSLWMKMLERDLPTLNSDLSNSLLMEAERSLSRGKENIEASLKEFSTPQTLSAAITSGSSTTKSSGQRGKGKDST